MQLGTIHRFCKWMPVAVLVIAGLFAKTAKADEVIFEGNGFITSFTDRCEIFDFISRDLLDIAYVPANIGRNGPDTLFSFFAGRLYTQGYTLRQGSFSEEWQTVDGGGAGYGVPYQLHPSPEVLIRQQTPAVIRRGTQALRMRMSIRNFGGIRGCRATIDMNLTRRPW